jgi:nicotinate phosphoribosyltransferase
MDTCNSLLLTDLYELTMLHAYQEEQLDEQATFEFFVRSLPPERNFLMAAGLETILSFVEQARFRTEELEWLSSLGRFPAAFIDHLAQWRFRGDIHAMPEGTLVFPQEPLLRVSAALPEAQLLESRLINLLHLETLIASKAARCVLASPEKLLVDFGLRRAHGAEAGLLSARAAYLAGFDGSATVLAGQRYGIPLYGTMAHSYVQVHRDEAAAFLAFAAAQPDSLTFLIDTYDTEAGADTVAALAPKLRQLGLTVKAVRLDSGDLAVHAKRVRSILDAAGLQTVEIFCSGNLDEHALAKLNQAGAPINGFGIGTRLDVSADAPYLDCAYKLTEYAGRPKRKRSEGKVSWPGRKQVWRCYDDHGLMVGDTVGLQEETMNGTPLLKPVMRAGRRLDPQPSLLESRQHAQDQLSRLPPPLRALSAAPPYPVTLSTGIQQLAAEADAATRF